MKKLENIPTGDLAQKGAQYVENALGYVAAYLFFRSHQSIIRKQEGN